jgi:stage V sporulation protein G
VEITEVRIKLVEDSQERLRAFCSITIDRSFVVRDLKIINGTKGPFVAMPSRKLTDRCGNCGTKNCLRAEFCNQCGRELPSHRAEKGPDGRAKLYADIAHPINSSTRESIQERVLVAFEQELLLADQPGYECRYDEFADAGDFDSNDVWTEPAATETPPAAEISQSSEHRRIEPAGEAPAPPHHPQVHADRRQYAHESTGDAAVSEPQDEFGAGII